MALLLCYEFNPCSTFTELFIHLQSQACLYHLPLEILGGTGLILTLYFMPCLMNNSGSQILTYWYHVTTDGALLIQGVRNQNQTPITRSLGDDAVLPNPLLNLTSSTGWMFYQPRITCRTKLLLQRDSRVAEREGWFTLIVEELLDGMDCGLSEKITSLYGLASDCCQEMSALVYHTCRNLRQVPLQIRDWNWDWMACMIQQPYLSTVTLEYGVDRGKRDAQLTHSIRIR